MEKTKHYIDNKELLEEVIKSKENPTPRLCFLIKLIAINVLNMKRYQVLIPLYRQDAVQEAMIKCLKVREKFDTTRSSSIFPFFTSVIGNLYFDLIKKYFKIKTINIDINDIDNLGDF